MAGSLPDQPEGVDQDEHGNVVIGLPLIVVHASAPEPSGSSELEDEALD